MRLSTIGYCFKQGFKNIIRNRMFSLASIATIAACLFIFGTFYCIGVNAENIINEAQTSVGITVFFDEGTTEKDILNLQGVVELREEVDHVNYVSAEQAWEDYKEQNFAGEDDEVMRNLDQENPLANSANLEIYMKDTSRQGELIEFLESVEVVRSINSSDALADSFSSFSNMVTYVFLALTIILFLVSIFLISNTISTGIAVRSEEIAIMKYIGATDAFVKGPFYVEGIVIGLLGSGIPVLILRILYNRILDFILDEFSILSNLLSFVKAGEVFNVLTPVALGLGVGIGFIGSYLTLRRRIRV